MFYSLKKKFSNDKFDVVYKIAPFESSGLFKRFIICIWAIFNQGDVNHISGDINFLCIFLNKKKTITTILDNYSYYNLNGLKKKIFYFFWILIPYLKSKHLHFISNKIKDETEEILKKKISNFKIINCCVADEFKFQLKKNFSNNILFIGSTKNKNLKTLLKAIKGVKNNNLKLLLVSSLNKEEKKFLLKNNISFKNYSNINNEQLLSIYSKSDILVFPSLYEGFGMPLIEANSLGIPVITSNISPMKDICRHSALLINPYNYNNLKSKILLLMNDKELRRKMVMKGKINARKYNSSLIAKKFLQLYKKLLT